MTARKKILIVDDDHDMLDLMEIFLYTTYDIVTAMNGFEALSKVEEEKPSLILTDIKMPVMDGIRFFNNLKKKEATRNIPVFAVTSFIQESSAKSLSSMGFDEVLSKPPDCALLWKTIARYLESDDVTKKQKKTRSPKK